jgi:hypothetical protein
MKPRSNKKHIFTILIPLLFILAACEKVVKIPLNTVNPLLVVEANLSSDSTDKKIVKLSHTVDYYSGNTFPAVSGAVVVISDNAGNSETLIEISSGTYSASVIKGIPGRTYNLNITTDKNYTGISSMPYQVKIDSLNIIELQSQGGGNPFPQTGKRYRVVCKFTDPSGDGNYYRIALASNDTIAVSPTRTQYRLISDKLTDGQVISATFNRLNFLTGDTVRAILQCIDKATYDFYNTLGNVQGDNNAFLAAPPSNPVNNISNGGLGYFSAYAVSKTFTVVP